MHTSEAPVRTIAANRALLVDDDKFMLTVLSDMLRDFGVSAITTAGNGSAGIAALERMGAAPDLVVCDLNMPGADGFQFMEQLGKRGFSGGVILVSGMDARTLGSASLMARFHRLKILATLTKPVDATALRDALNKLTRVGAA
jgi:CheY-like chemotaxis protein